MNLLASRGNARPRSAQTSTGSSGAVGEQRPLGLSGGLVAAVLVAVALSAVLGDVRVASISSSEIVAGVAGGAVWTVLLLLGRVPRASARAALPFAAFTGSMLVSLVLGRVNRQGLQFLMVQVAFLGAFLLTATARRVVGTGLEAMAARCFRISAVVLGGATTLGALGVGHAIGGTRPSAIVALLGMGWFLAEYRCGHRRSLWWALGILLEILISLSRTALVAGFAMMVVTLLFGSRAHRARNTTLCVLLLICGSWAVTSWAPLHDRFVQGDVSLSVGGFNVNAEGRTQIWKTLWSEVPDHLVVGHGPGTAAARSASLADIDQPHNDYLRILYDFGILGFGLLTWFVVRSTRALRRAAKRVATSLPALAALYAGLAILIMMVTDNPLDYPFVMIPLGAMIGLGLGGVRVRSAVRTSGSARR